MNAQLASYEIEHLRKDRRMSVVSKDTDTRSGAFRFTNSNQRAMRLAKRLCRRSGRHTQQREINALLADLEAAAGHPVSDLKMEVAL